MKIVVREINYFTNSLVIDFKGTLSYGEEVCFGADYNN